MGIQGYASLMLVDMGPGQPHYEKLRSIEDQVRKGAELTRQLLGFARGGRYEVKPLNFNDVVRKCSAMFGRSKKELTIHRRLKQGLWTVEGDRGQIEKVLMTLFVNAWQAMPGGGALDLETAPGLWGGREIVSIRVTDTGPGIPSHQLARLYQPFYTTKAHGTGLGLSLSRKYVRAHGGELQVTSPAGYGPDGGPRGTSIRIMLPVEGATEAMAALAAAATASAADAAEEPHG